MGPKTVELLQLLQDTIEILQGYGERWADWMLKSRRRIKSWRFERGNLALESVWGNGKF